MKNYEVEYFQNLRRRRNADLAIAVLVSFGLGLVAGAVIVLSMGAL